METRSPYLLSRSEYLVIVCMMYANILLLGFVHSFYLAFLNPSCLLVSIEASS